MNRLVWIVLLFALITIAGCVTPVPEALRMYEGRSLFTCCNMHYEDSEITDANYYIGSMLPLRTPVQVTDVAADSVTFKTSEGEFTVSHRYGLEKESFSAYIAKYLVAEDPTAKLAAYPADIQQAIRAGQVRRGMTREQVLLAIGYPPYQTFAADGMEWGYWYNRWMTFTINFDESDKVNDMGGKLPPGF